MPQRTHDGVTVGIGHRSGPGGAVKPADANHSEYMTAILAAQDGFVYNPCPFGCPDDEIDEHGRCYHRVGVSPDGKLYEPEVRRPDGKVVVQPKMAPNKQGRLRPVLEKVDPKRHHLIRVTTSFLVYEDRDPPPEWVGGETDPDDVPDDPDTEDEGDD